MLEVCAWDPLRVVSTWAQIGTRCDARARSSRHRFRNPILSSAHEASRKRNEQAAALAPYRSDPVQARYQSWETPYPVDSARALIVEMRNVRFAQHAVWPQISIETRPAGGSSATSRSAPTATPATG